MNVLANLGTNILAEILFWLGFGILCYLAIRLAQGRFLDFFGVRGSRKLLVYLSNLWQGREGEPNGSVVSGQEFRATRTVAGLFGDAPLRLPELVRGLVDVLFSGDKVDVSIDVSPLLHEELRFTNMIVVGATAKNCVRRYYFASGLLSLCLAGESEQPQRDVFIKEVENRVRILKGPQTDQVIGGNYNLAIVERVRDEVHGVVVILCAGFRGDSSWAATEYLAKNWRMLAKEYRNKSFALCLGFPMSEGYMPSYVEPTVLARFSA
jgi:hypothetical protein